MAEIKREDTEARERIESTTKKWNENMMMAFVVAIVLSLISVAGLIVTRLYLYTGH